LIRVVFYCSEEEAYELKGRGIEMTPSALA
jgi:hypothetical protein